MCKTCVQNNSVGGDRMRLSSSISTTSLVTSFNHVGKANVIPTLYKVILLRYTALLHTLFMQFKEVIFCLSNVSTWPIITTTTFKKINLNTINKKGWIYS